MAQRSLPDTNICILAYQRPDLAVRQRMRTAEHEALFISSLSAAELAVGVVGSQRTVVNRALPERFLAGIQVLPWTQRAVWHYAAQRQRLKALGQPIGNMDSLLAAQALGDKLVLVTHNHREFDRVEGLAVGDWTEPMPHAQPR